jgi:hypothetical protein
VLRWQERWEHNLDAGLRLWKILGSVGLPEVTSLGPESLRDFVW